MNVIPIPGSATSRVVNVTGTAASSGVFSSTGQTKFPSSVFITPTLNCFVRMTATATPAVLADGTDMFLAANQMYQTVIPDGYYLNFIKQTGATDSPVYITPVA